MNKIYKLVWNAATGCWSAASEFARKGKPGRVSAAFVLLAVAEPSVAACQSQNGASAIVSEEKQIITCTDNGDSNKPYKITTGNTVLENNGTMTGSPNNGNQYQTADATTGIGVLGTDSPHDKVLVKNNGSILWDKALNLGTSDFVSAVLLNKPANNNNTSITSVGFENEKNAKVSITMAESPDKSPVAAVMAYADNGTATFKNAGTIDLQVPVVKSSDAPNTEPSQPKAVYGYYSQAMMADVSNSGTIRVNAPQGSIQAEGMEILSTGKNGGTVKNSGSIDVTTNNASAWGIWFKADGETAIENSGKISVIAGSDSSTPDDSGTGITVAGNKVEHGSVEVINNSDSDGGVYVKTTRGDATGINFHSTVDNSALKNSSLISVWSESGVARGLDSESLYSSDIVNTNTGTIMAVSGKKEATGLYTENNYNKITINNEGKIGAASQGGAARGIHVKLKKDYQNNTIGIDNSGEIQVGSSDTDSAGIAVTDLTSGTREASIINNGKISLLGGEAGKAGNRAGIQFVQNNAASSLGTTLSFTNKENGEVDADENSSGILLSASDSSTTKVSVENYGTLKAGTALTLRGGDDSFVQYKGLTQGALLMGEGNNTVTLNDGIVRGNIFSGDGNDSYTQTNGTMSGHISLGNGNNEIIINGGNLTGNVTTGNGKDSYRQISDNAIVNSDISLGDGNNSFILSTNGTHSRDASVIGNLTAGSGNDTLAMKNITVKGDVALGNGNNLLMLDNSMLGDDVGTTGDITTGNGDDVLTLSGVSSVRNISLGDGDNILAMSGAVIDGAVKTGSGDDRLMFVRGTDADTSDSEIPSNLYTVTNNSGRDISLGDGNNTVIMNRDITFDNGENSIITGEGDD
ncbi:ESPR domain-containing protein, partial [Escherichia coli]|nr:ESPR domain-containing protein [Escherichia coli]EIB8375223.1 ESPR domain-containing protein [Escherichia coli]EIM6617708.1 ESPR domain-containing protein [Escherichia coli]EKN4252552.1 ESPR domain-containing protein [Escherichia coli]